MTPAELQHGKWYLLFKRIGFRDEFDLMGAKKFTDLIKIEAPPNQFYADPFSVQDKDGNEIIFFEQWEAQSVEKHHGWLSYLVVTPENEVQGPHRLDIPKAPHMSFPYVFQENGEWYMIPETCHLSQINLYKCTNWPGQWQLVKTIIPNAHAGDSTIIKHNGKYWLFTYDLKGHSYQFCIYYADAITGPWQPHKIVNKDQIQPDNEKLTRGAGRVFHYGGKIIRPAQMSHRGINGEGIILYQVETLTEDTYHEVPVKIITAPENLGEGRAMHTFSVSSSAILMDARVERPNIDEPYVNIEQPKVFNKIMESNYYINHEMMHEAFSINTSGNGKCYYGIELDGHTYPGERNWNLRWDLIKDCIDWTDKNVIDFGCNMGIGLTYLRKFRKIGVANGYEATDEFLKETNKPRTIEALRKLEDAFGISDKMYLTQTDLNNLTYKDFPVHDPNGVAIAMSILKWIDNHHQFMEVLAKFDTVIYEGHDSDEEELARFAKYGFTGKILGKTQTGASYPDDDMRTLILFTK